MIKEAVLSLLPAHTTEIISYQNCLWIEVLLQNLHTVAVAAGRICNLNPCGRVNCSEQKSVGIWAIFLRVSAPLFLELLFPVPLLTWLTSVPESSQMRRTPWQPIEVCAVTAASQCSHFSQFFVVKFCINLFQFLHLKKLNFVCYILWLSRRWGCRGTWWRKWEPLKAGKINGKLSPRICLGCSAKSHIGSISGLRFLPDWPLGLNTNEWNEWMNILWRISSKLCEFSTQL